MITNSGASVWPKGSKFYNENESPELSDIARGLARMVRFAGQTRDYYTVLLHTLTVADIIAPEFREYALLHDAPESIVSDVVTTWKTQAAKDREHELLELITVEYKRENPDSLIEWPWPQGAVDAVADADEVALAAEAHALGHVQAEHYWPYKRYQRRTGFYEAESLTERRKALAMHYAVQPFEAAVLYEQAFQLELLPL